MGRKKHEKVFNFPKDNFIFLYILHFYLIKKNPFYRDLIYFCLIE
ncbi:hypothetical protein BBUBOL26_0338 [Borreliella burgdorferi Bol26]|nr:hypothetical protein BBUBOL26_0338 [Borreliella burgdorferi Bol26]